MSNMAIKLEDKYMPALSVVAPCHNEEENIGALLARVSKVCRETVDDSYEIVLVNDGSSDRTWDMIQKAAQSHPNIVGVNLSRNHGHQLALSAGLSVASGDRILIIDADLQDPPELLPEMIALMDEGADVVYGQRRIRPGDSVPRKAASAIFYRLLQRLSDVEIPLDAGDFRLVSRRVLDVLLKMPEHHRFIRGMISWVGFHQVPIEYDRDQRQHGETGYTLKKLVSFAVDAITGFSVRPLRLATYVGVLTAVLGMIYTAYIVYRWAVLGISVEGWPSLMAAIMVLGSLQLLFLGLIGEYVGRLFEQAKHRPLFVIKDIVSSPASGGKKAKKKAR